MSLDLHSLEHSSSHNHFSCFRVFDGPHCLIWHYDYPSAGGKKNSGPLPPRRIQLNCSLPLPFVDCIISGGLSWRLRQWKAGLGWSIGECFEENEGHVESRGWQSTLESPGQTTWDSIVIIKHQTLTSVYLVVGLKWVCFCFLCCWEGSSPSTSWEEEPQALRQALLLDCPLCYPFTDYCHRHFYLAVCSCLPLLRGGYSVVEFSQTEMCYLPPGSFSNADPPELGKERSFL